MYLKEVIINGFKSFADRTKIELAPGVVTIVGPNGCGKSNIADAIRWVLGEQSAKALRGGKMHDVIFAGTDTRPPLPMCEVSLTFTDCEKELGTAFNEVEILRRVSIEGSGEYYLNGKACRLKEIQQLFMDTGIGRVSYSFLVQGQIDRILSNNPLERRVIFEEAAGITRYKSQRRDALNKLALVDQNLSRVTDVVDEVQRQMASLKRQASKAVRYKRIKHRLTHLELAFSSHQFVERNSLVEDLEKKATNLRQEVTRLASELSGEEEILEGKKSERGELYEGLQEAQQSVFDLRSEKEQAANQAELALMRQKDAQERIKQIEGETRALDAQVEELESKVKDDAQVKQLQLNLVDTSDVAYKERSDELEAVQEALGEREYHLQQKKQGLVALEGGIHRLRSRSTELEIELRTNEAKHQDLETKSAGSQAKHNELQDHLNTVSEALDAQEEKIGKVSQEESKAQEHVTSSREAFRETQGKIQDQDRQVARLNAQVGVLEDLQSKLEGFSDGAKALLQGDLGGENTSLLTKGLDVDEAYMGALETLLGQAVDAVALDEIDRVGEIAEALMDRGLGRACLQVVMGQGRGLKNETNLPDGMRPAGDVVKAKATNMAQRWGQLLDGCYFCDRLETFLDFWKENQDFQFLLVATQGGELIDARGLVYVGNAKGGESGFIKREAEIRTLKQTLEGEKGKLALLTKEGLKAQDVLTEAEEAMEEKRKLLNEAGHDFSRLQVEEREASNALKQNDDLMQSTAQQLKALDEARERAKERLAEAQKELEREQLEIEVLRQAVAEGEEAVNKMRLERDAKREGLSEVKFDLIEKRQRLNLIDQGLDEVNRQREGIEKRRVQCEQEIARLGDQIGGFGREAENLKAKAEELEKTLQQHMSALEQKKQGLMTLEEDIRGVEEALSGRRKTLHDCEDELKCYDVSLAKERSQNNFLLEKARSEYQVELVDVDWKQELWLSGEEFKTRLNLDDLEEGLVMEIKPKKERGEATEKDLAAMESTDWGAVEKEVKGLKERLMSMGAVNLVAIEEYAALKERYNFLKAQCDDLINSKEQLLKAIEDINKTSETLFKETFEKVRQNFTYTFDALFGGGYADLQLMEAEDVLESGIEITARPPGTKLKGLSLLSGGQKTMTAVALLFAIYKVKPSPFCVLDELDAPLDDANIGRFTSMLREFTKYSQFLVVSHNKRTIAASDMIYGVTMQERGVTSLVSMRFNHESGKTEALTGDEDEKIDAAAEEDLVESLV